MAQRGPSTEPMHLSQVARIIARLREGPATSAQLQALLRAYDPKHRGGVIHSRVASARDRLRGEGLTITCERLKGRESDEAYLYRLVQLPADHAPRPTVEPTGQACLMLEAA